MSSGQQDLNTMVLLLFVHKKFSSSLCSSTDNITDGLQIDTEITQQAEAIHDRMTSKAEKQFIKLDSMHSISKLN